ncbi:alpha/beta hydrolase [Modestobacter sp. VKM Ac-2986]|uniref:alpha/beta fold hydrolase n=1 Tax=Modestobacter sp. VKM Ac-2986 TaxID=3004140 RepID=UPI0022AACEB6|nr:alpha/beta hydrolase [Modestobacter sp. VKM Ac-2986]MCZ2829094.1 alpha/beta hydrolase [Modestobacter sp. VKM Ac-2986]
MTTPTTTTQKPTIVIVHGAWSDASPFDAVDRLLAADGYTVTHFANPLRALGDDTDQLVAFLKARTTGPVVLVGHSYGGAVIGGAALSHPEVGALVYLNAFVPAEGETILDLAGHAGPVDAGALFDMAPFPGDHNVDLYLKPDAFAAGFVNGLPAELAATFFAKQRPIAYAALTEPARADQAWQTLPSWYVAGSDDHSIAFETQLWMAQRAGSVLTQVATGHLSMTAEPEVVAQVIAEAAAKN